VRKSADKRWAVATPDAKGKDIVSPSEVNHSSVPFPKQRDKKTDDNYYDGVTIEYAEQTTTLSLIGLRRLRFPVKGLQAIGIDVTARTVLAALGLCAATLAFESGIGLRSRCLLWPEGPMKWELLLRPGHEPCTFEMTGDQAVALLTEAIAEKDAKLPWREDPVVLKPSTELLELVRLSQLEATKESAGQGS